MAEPIIDIHQHTNYADRSDVELLRHQRHMGVTQTILLPAGTPVERPSTHMGKSNGLAAKITGNDAAIVFAANHPVEYFFFANEVPDLPKARQEIGHPRPPGNMVLALEERRELLIARPQSYSADVAIGMTIDDHSRQRQEVSWLDESEVARVRRDRLLLE